MPQVIQFPAQIMGVKKLQDGTISVTVHTQELPADDMAQIFSLKGMVWTAIKQTEVKPEDLDIPEVTAEFPQDKTPSQRLRGVLFRVWEATGKKGEFELFYRRQMNNLIEQFKEKLT